MYTFFFENKYDRFSLIFPLLLSPPEPSSDLLSPLLPRYQVFLQDKRSAMRLHNPLPNRAIVRADSNQE
jgi:hypothetical protein